MLDENSFDTIEEAAKKYPGEMEGIENRKHLLFNPQHVESRMHTENIIHHL